MIAQGDFHLFDPGIMPAQVFTDLFMFFSAVSFPALHLDDQLIDRSLQGSDTVVKLIKEKTDQGNCDDLDHIENILEDKV